VIPREGVESYSVSCRCNSIVHCFVIPREGVERLKNHAKYVPAGTDACDPERGS